jgi:hypothetical protein
LLGPYATRAIAPELAAMFVGVGEIAPRTTTPTRAKIALPMLGKVKPAHAEVTPSAEKKSGDALREILPALFDDERGR